MAEIPENKVLIKVNKTTEVAGDKGKPLLHNLRENQIFLSSACGGKGACGQCRVTAVSGFNSEYNQKELFHIPPEERERNIRLACQQILQNNVEISIPEDLLCTKRYEAQVVKIRELTYDIKEITLKISDSDGISFKAGQFIQFEIPEYELSREAVYRPYSISNPPSQNHTVQLEVRYVPNGIGTTYIHKYLKENDKVSLNGPFGKFYLRESDNDIVFIAGSTGLSPVRSILYDMAERKINRKAMFLFGATSRKDLFLVDEMRELEKALPNFKYIPALSKPEPEDNWDGESGLITDVASKYIQSGDKTEAYLCGSPAMINACVKILKAKGITEDRIFYDRFA
jgi:Na+-transporting NADH:ubiquinone oxidoreductase subunit F